MKEVHQQATSVTPAQLNALGVRSSQPDQLQNIRRKMCGLDAMDESHLHTGLVPDLQHLPHKFQEHLCKQLVDVVTYPYTVAYAVNEATEQNVQLVHAIASI